VAELAGARTLLVVSAHSADFVWRAAGAIATVTGNGGSAHVVALSFGEQGESGELWKEPGRTIDEVKRIRNAEAEEAAGILGASFRCLDLGDYPLVVDAAALGELTALMRELRADVVLGHAERDPFNPDHPVAHDATVRARLLASGSGVASAFETVPPAQLLLFEPHQPELCGFVPTTFLDITPVYPRKVAAMEAMQAQQYLRQYYGERAEHRANHAQRISGNKEIRYAEAFQRAIPQVVTSL
jgi:4-oxalomesaconate hydratase